MTRSQRNSITGTDEVGRSLSYLRDLSHIKSFQGSHSHSANDDSSIVGVGHFYSFGRNQKRQRSLTHVRNKSSGLPLVQHVSIR